MAEERIMICSSTDYTITETDKGELFEGKIEPHCANVFTRQEAIERIAKKICAYSWETLNELAQERYMERAEAALNALLERE